MSDRELLNEIRESIIELRTLWNGGPGGWPVCIAHTEKQKDHETRLRKLELRIYLAIGGGMVLAGLLPYVMPRLIQIL